MWQIMTLFLAKKNYIQSSDFYFEEQRWLENQDEAHNKMQEDLLFEVI